ncbi:flagellar motor protein MotB [Opitutaceae bacterium TAV5]|nr:flagellar motor protein MotB [Opitutaceae bacterium TAV5]
MKVPFRRLAFTLVAVLLTGGCATHNDGRITNPDQPGPAIGNAAGAVVGAVAGNAAGAVVGVGEGVAWQTKEVFNNDHQVVRRWQTVTTSDGRTVQVPVEIAVDKYGVPLADKRAAASAASTERPSATPPSQRK